MEPNPAKRTKSRTGCVTCKKRRLKCDETKPTCLKCAQRKVVCGGYVKNFKWRSFEETNVCAKVAKNQPVRPASQPANPQRDLHDQSIEDLIQAALRSTQSTSPLNPERTLSRQNSPLYQNDPLESYNELASTMEPNSLDYPQEEHGFNPLTSLFMNFTSMNSDFVSTFPSPTGVSINSGFTPPVSTPEPQKSNALLHRGLTYKWTNETETHKAINKWIDKYKSRDELQQIISSKPFFPPLYLSDDHDRIFQLYTRYTCGILSIKDGPTENPWRTTLWPLAQEHGSLYHAVAALTKLHHSRNSPELQHQAVNHIKESLRFLVTGLTDRSLPPDVALATALSLSLSEAWNRDVSSSVPHLQGASTILRQLVRQHRGKSLPPWLQFLHNCWLYLDICARLVSDAYVVRTHMDEIDMPPKSLNADNPSTGSLSSGYSDNPDTFSAAYDCDQSPSNESSQQDEVDPLIGCGQNLFPLIGEVASLVQMVRKNEKPSLLLINHAVELKQRLENWSPTISLQMTKVEDPAWDLQSCLSTAESYRYAALLYLHQAVPEIPSPTSHELAEKVMVLLASIPASSRTAVVQVFPLLAASCEAQGEEREWVKSRWNVLRGWMPTGNIEKAFEVVHEVWRRKDVRSNERNVKVRTHEGLTDSTSIRSSAEIAASISLKVAEAFGSKFVDENMVENGIKGWCHWTAVMRDRGWEILLG